MTTCLDRGTTVDVAMRRHHEPIMTDEEYSMAECAYPYGDSHVAIDNLVLESMGQRLERKIREALNNFQSVRDELMVLSKEQGLPLAYREAYARLLGVAVPVCDAMDKARREVSPWPAAWLNFARADLGVPPEAWVARCKQVVAEINAVDLEMTNSLREAQDLLLKGQPGAIFDWTMPASVEVVLTLEPGPLRSIYNQLDEEYVGEDRYRFMVDVHYKQIPTSEEVSNWSEFLHPEHPLSERACHMEYLCHCILFHLGLPWQLLPCIHEIEATLKFHDYQTIWPVENREVRVRRNRSE